MENAVLSAAKMDIADEVPWSNKLTPYDVAHLTLYLELLNIADGRGNERDICSRLLNIDADHEPARARTRFESHLKRARWVSTEGLHLLFHDDCDCPRHAADN
jgi:hypothetical protein